MPDINCKKGVKLHFSISFSCELPGTQDKKRSKTIVSKF